MYSIIKKQGICSTLYNSPSSWLAKKYRPYPGGVASRLVTDIYVTMVMPVLYDISYNPNDSNLKYVHYWLYG